MLHRMSQRSPFENRWTSGRVGWRWYRTLETCGADDVRRSLARQHALSVAPEIPEGFIRDWLAYRDRKALRSAGRWRLYAGGGGLLIVVIVAMAVWRLMAP